MVNNRVQVFTNTGTFLRAWGNHGSGDGQFDLPSGIAVDSSGNVYVADRDNYRVQVFNNAGVFLGKWGSFGSGDGQFLYPWGIAIDSIGNVYVLDFGNYRVQVFGGYSATNIDTTPPTVTVSANPNVLWPPNNKMVDIEIDGSATDEGSGIASIVITVTDEYGVYNMTVPGFGSTIRLEASRKGTDKDGRVYTITAVATDNAGNQATATTTVIVPHDQR
jgi:hypothetical protein